MPKRCANIHKRKDGRWEGRIKIGKYPNGATKYRSIYGKTYSEVKSRLESEKNIEHNSIVMRNSPKTFKDIVILWLSSVKISIKQSTLYRYEYLIKKHIIPDIGQCKMNEITSTKINVFLENKLTNGRLNGKGPLSSSYVKSIANLITSVIKYAVAEDLCAPMKSKIVKPASDKKELPVLSVLEQKQLKNYIDDNEDLSGLGIMISLYSGLRIGEICALSWDDIDLNLGIIHVRHTVVRIKNDNSISGKKTQLIIDKPKTKSSQRDIPISSALLPYLIRASQNMSSKYVISNSEFFISPRTFEYRYHKILEKSDISDINYHVLRHTFATRCVEAGVDIKSLSEILGHSSVAITLNTYVHSSIELKRKQLEKLFA